MAERVANRNERMQALSCLEESACHACMALITLYTGHPQDPQMLSRLLQYCDNFCIIRNRVFPCNTAEETELLQTLERAVLTEGTSHHEHIPAYIVDMLLKRIHKMLELADWLYTRKTGTTQSKTTSPYPHLTAINIK